MSRKYFSLNSLDFQIEKYLLKPGIVKFYVELGANDGISQSNTLHFEKYHGFKGILIEPSNYLMKALKINRGRNNYLFGFACVQFGFSEPIIKLTYSNLMTKAHLGIPGGSVSENQIAMEAHLHANSGKKFLQFRERVKIISSKTITLNEILLNSKAPKLMGLLSLDVEGSELNVLMGINHDYFRFQYLLIETNNFHAINQYLIKNEYVFLERLSYHDYIFENAKQDRDL